MFEEWLRLILSTSITSFLIGLIAFLFKKWLSNTETQVNKLKEDMEVLRNEQTQIKIDIGVLSVSVKAVNTIFEKLDRLSDRVSRIEGFLGQKRND